MCEAMECFAQFWGGAEREWAFNFLHCLLVEHAEKTTKRSLRLWQASKFAAVSRWSRELSSSTERPIPGRVTTDSGLELSIE